ncbi:MAG: exosortase [Acetobacteraceae bacterium]|nr:exosortase [Acetobacteraceae bacterium]
MQPLTEARARPTAAISGQRGPALPTLAALAGGLAALGLLFLPEIRAAVFTWNTSTAYGHCYLVLPMALYLLWERREVLSQVPARAEPWLALLALPVAAVWFVAERLGIMEGRQLMAVAGLEVLLLVVLGRPLFLALSGPLLYLFFLVPFGAFLTPWLQHFTAVFSDIGLDVLGIPHYADDLIIEIPAGTFFVAEACAGLRFLIAAVAFGVFYALLNYRSPFRRAGFILASIIVPIIANGFRALGIVVLGHLLGSAEAAAADHVLYGWIFFSIVMLLLVLGGMPFRESHVPRPALVPAVARRSPGQAAFAAVATLAVVALGPAGAAALNARATAVPLTSIPALQLPEGCSRAEDPPLGGATRVSFKVACSGFVFEVAIQSFPARATSSSLVAARRRITGEYEAEDTSFSSLSFGGGQGNWTLVETLDPYRTTALASWVRGRPAGVGLVGRLEQARDSILGSNHAVILMSIGARQENRLAVEQQQRLVSVLKTLVAAQTDLNQQMEALSRLR